MTLSNECSRVKRFDSVFSVALAAGFPDSGVALAAGSIPAATLSLMSPSVASSDYKKNPNRIPEREQARRAATGR